METIRLLKQHRAALMVSVLANLGAMLFGFDTGIAGAVISMKRYGQKKRSGNPPVEMRE